MGCFNDLSYEILEPILDQLYVGRAPLVTLKHANLVCRRLHSIASKLLYQHITIDPHYVDPARNVHILNHVIGDAGVRSTVRFVTVRLSRSKFLSRSIQRLLEQCLPKLPNLEQVRFRGDFGINDDGVSMKKIRPSLLRVVEGLDAPVTLEINCYVHTLNKSLRLDRISRLHSFRVFLLNNPPENYEEDGDEGDGNRELEGEGEDSEEDEEEEQLADATELIWQIHDYRNIVHFGKSMPSQQISSILKQNSGLRHLALCLPQRGGAYAPQLELEERKHALRRIVPSLPYLRSLRFEGALQFSAKTWSAWDAAVNWTMLESLSIGDANMTDFLAERLCGRLPSLRILKLASYFRDLRDPPACLSMEAVSLKAFLSSLRLTHLSLYGIHHSVLLEFISQRGSSLRKLQFTDQPLKAKGALLCQSVLGSLLYQSCPRLESLILQIEQCNVISETVKSLSRSSEQEQQLPLDEDAPHSHTLRDSLNLFASFRSLQHVGFSIVYDPRKDRSDMNISSHILMSIFAYMRTHKRGTPLESVAFTFQLRTWTMWELGPRVAELRYMLPGARRVREIWNTDRMELLGIEESKRSGPRWSDQYPFKEETWMVDDGW